MGGTTVTETSIQELCDACLVLFGPETAVSEAYLKYLRPSGLKTAYRKVALETHPDRARTLGKHASDLNARFAEVASAYRKLKAYTLLALLGKQRKLQSRFGEYFLQNGWFTSTQTDAFCKMQQQHNLKALRNKWQ